MNKITESEYLAAHNLMMGMFPINLHDIEPLLNKIAEEWDIEVLTDTEVPKRE